VEISFWFGKPQILRFDLYDGTEVDPIIGRGFLENAGVRCKKATRFSIHAADA